MLRIRQILQPEINQLQNFPPDDWNLDLPKLVSFHFGYPYFYPIVAEVNDKIIGYGNGILHGSVGWLGDIIVVPEYRRQGIGYEITIHLVEYFKEKGCTSQLLIASDMGKNIYSKIGFKTSATYMFYQGGSKVLIQHSKDIREISQSDISSVKELDKEIMGEGRFHLIKRFLSTGWIYAREQSTAVGGVYLPDFGSGLIIVGDAAAGLELMKFRLSRGKTNAVVPSTNVVAREFLESEGYQIYRTAPRMVLGKDVDWQPHLVFNRATGYCG